MQFRKIVARKGNPRRYPMPNGHVTISYNSWTHDPTKIEDAFRGRQIGKSMDEVTIQIGKGVLLATCESELLKMCVGEKAYLILPSSMAYGSKGIPHLVPPNTDIVIIIELLDISAN